MPPHSITNFEIQEYHWNEPKFNRAHSRNSLPRVRDGTYVINLDEYESTGTHWIALYLNGGNVGASNMQHIFLALKLELSLQKLKNSYVIKILQQIFIECKYTTQYCVDSVLFGLLILCWKVKVC